MGRYSNELERREIETIRGYESAYDLLFTVLKRRIKDRYFDSVNGGSGGSGVVKSEFVYVDAVERMWRDLVDSEKEKNDILS